MNVLQYRWYYIKGDDAYYIIGDSAITLTVISVLQYRLVITLSVLITLSVVTDTQSTASRRLLRRRLRRAPEPAAADAVCRGQKPTALKFAS